MTALLHFLELMYLYGIAYGNHVLCIICIFNRILWHFLKAPCHNSHATDLEMIQSTAHQAILHSLLLMVNMLSRIRHMYDLYFIRNRKHQHMELSLNPRALKIMNSINTSTYRIHRHLQYNQCIHIRR